LSSKGLGRLAYQFSDSPNLLAFLQAFLDEFDELQASGQDLLSNRYLDTAEGVQLDGIGEIVGLDRPSLAITDGLFGFVGDPTALGFTDIYDTSLGGHFYGIGGSFQLVNDDLYRTIIKAKIKINTSNMTVDDTTETLSFMFDGVSIKYALPTNLNPHYTIYKVLTSSEVQLLDLIPLMLGLGNVTYSSLASTWWTTVMTTYWTVPMTSYWMTSMASTP